MCLAEVILCQSVSYSDGVFVDCDEFTAQRPVMCEVISIDGDSLEVNCYKDAKKRYNIADNDLNKNNQHVSQEICDEQYKLP